MIYLVLLITDQWRFSDEYGKSAESSTDIICVTNSLKKAKEKAREIILWHDSCQTIELWKCDESDNSRERILYYNDDSVSQ